MSNKDIDPFELAFLDYYNGNAKNEITIHCNKGDVDVVPLSYFFRTFENMPDIEKKALELCTGKVLDIGAGSGCHSLILKSQGLDVIALDIRSSFVDIMKKRGLSKTVCSDVYSFSEDSFDTLLMLMNGIGFAGDLKGLSRFLSHAKKLLKSGGQILLDSTDILYLYKEEENGSVTINLNEDYYGEVLYQFEYKDIVGLPFKWLFVDFATLCEMAEQEGFRCELMMEDGYFNYLARLYSYHE